MAKVLEASMRMQQLGTAAERGFDFIECCFDGSQQEAVNKEKMHVSLFTASSVLLDDTDDVADFDIDRLAATVKTARVTGDLQVVKCGSGAETYNNVKANTPHTEMENNI